MPSTMSQKAVDELIRKTIGPKQPLKPSLRSHRVCGDSGARWHL
jgi:hypothetical protein